MNSVPLLSRKAARNPVGAAGSVAATVAAAAAAAEAGLVGLRFRDADRLRADLARLGVPTGPAGSAP